MPLGRGAHKSVFLLSAFSLLCNNLFYLFCRQFVPLFIFTTLLPRHRSNVPW